MKNKTIKGLLLLVTLASLGSKAQEEDFSLEIASVLIVAQCNKAGLTDIKADKSHAAEMIAKKSGISINEAEKIMIKPSVFMKATDEASRLAEEIRMGKLTCDDMVAFIVGSLM